MKLHWSLRYLWLLPAIIILIIIPMIFPSGYLLNILINTMIWIIFALSFDLSAGHVGTVSLGHPVFFGLGAYVTGLIGSRLGLGFLGNILLSAGMMGLFALLTGVAFFRIKEVSFAIGTLGALIIAQLIANNAYDLTGGPMCVKGIARPEFVLPWSDTVIKIMKPLQYYYLLLPLLAISFILYRLLTTFRIGRAFIAVREDEVRAAAVGINPLYYKLLAYSVGGMLIGALGSFQAQYVTVICPSELAIGYTNNLLTIIFVGGAGSFGGVILGAFIFTVLPRLLELGGTFSVPPSYQQLAYGLILLIVILIMPTGLAGQFQRLKTRIQKSQPN